MCKFLFDLWFNFVVDYGYGLWFVCGYTAFVLALMFDVGVVCVVYAFVCLLVCNCYFVCIIISVFWLIVICLVLFAYFIDWFRYCVVY